MKQATEPTATSEARRILAKGVPACQGRFSTNSRVRPHATGPNAADARCRRVACPGCLGSVVSSGLFYRYRVGRA